MVETQGTSDSLPSSLMLFQLLEDDGGFFHASFCLDLLLSIFEAFEVYIITFNSYFLAIRFGPYQGLFHLSIFTFFFHFRSPFSSLLFSNTSFLLIPTPLPPVSCVIAKLPLS